jgi:hypothetical protein
MMKKITLLLTVLAFVAVSAFGAKPPATVTIDAAAKKQPAVKFAHDKHITRAKTCDQCHHDSKGLTADSKVEVKKCSACHLGPKPPVPSMREMSLTKNPFHIKCLGCHKEGKKGPTKCTECHIKVK